MADQSSSEADHRVIRFPGTRRSQNGQSQIRADSKRDSKIVPDLRRYDLRYLDETGGDDYRRRMIVNVIAAALILCLIAAGLWIANSLATWRHDQDCAMSGRRNCAPISVPQSQRW